MEVVKFTGKPTDFDALDKHFINYSYAAGWGPTQHDVKLFDSMSTSPARTNVSALRWFRHIASYTDFERNTWPEEFGGQPKSPAAAATSAPAKGGKKAAKKEEVKEDDDDFDLFGEQTEEEKAAVSNKKKEVKEGEEKKKKEKKPVISKSTLVFDIKPMTSETNLDEIEKKVRDITMEGLEWNQQAKKVALVYGLFKLQMGCVIVDDLVPTDEIQNQIETIGLTPEQAKERLAKRDGEEDDDDDDDEDKPGLVQSAEIISFQKL